MTYTTRLAQSCSVILLMAALLIVPGAVVSQGEKGVTGITLRALPNAVAVQWDAPQGIEVRSYTLYYAKNTSIIEHNGSFDESEATPNATTSTVITDLKNRGFVTGDTMYVTITYTDTAGNERVSFAEEKSVDVTVPVQMHGAAETLALTSALSNSPKEIVLQFSDTVTLPNAPHTAFTVTEVDTDTSVFVVSAAAEGKAVTLTTLPMTPLTHYTVTMLEGVIGPEDMELNADKRSATFVARGSAEAATPTPANDTTTDTSVASSSSSAAAVSSSSSSMKEAQAPSTDTEEDDASSSSSPAPTENGNTSSSVSSESSAASQQPEVEEAQGETTPTPEPDTTPPDDPTHLVLKKILQPDGLYTVNVSWKASTSDDVDTHNIYHRKSNNTYKVPMALGAVITSASLRDISPGTLTVKLSATDEAGNESDGVEEEIVLPETGPASTLALSVVGAGAWSVWRRKRRSY